MKIANILGILFSMACHNLHAQSTIETKNARVKQVVNNHLESNISHFISGKSYSPNYLGILNGPFFNGKYPEVNGFLVYDGVLYNDVETAYDLYSQEVVVLLDVGKKVEYIVIDQAKVEKFSIDEHIFHNLEGNNNMPKGIYELAFVGNNSKLFVKRMKKKKEEISNDVDINIIFNPLNEYYLVNESGTYQINTKKDLIKTSVNPAQASTIIKQSKLGFKRKNFGEDLLKVVPQIDQISKAN